MNGKIFNFLAVIFGLGATTISHESQSPCGYVHCQSANAKFELFYEFRSDVCFAIIHIPIPENWKNETKLPISQRAGTLENIGQQVVKDQTNGGRGYLTIEDIWLKIYS